ncbi:MAG: Na+/H+ antiporter subunit B [Planctomycetales bacterium]|nr:Na+/H+ antiporter subunit B [Planctomycetales bacterium]MCA9161663.1 Na+/H+ antiporter subunit B [Planctomycetales bacterium]MCA9205387.1 Na+/H+ antiporter subunit B [Planctomycetales bacterium]MCA9206917.1 Na+/H+ antiporter subunit B [Planctomycetales bacterium]MCA9224480.1 Na+/H+ antiporter subunit B [Planctomycetales bacterium]
MNSLVLRTAIKFMLPMLLLLSVFLLIQGHDQPGGGFVGGLVAAAGITLHALANDASSAKRIMRGEPHYLVGVGLLIAVISGVWGSAVGQTFLTGIWMEVPLGKGRSYSVGTPILFDLGVYFVVAGVTSLVLLSLVEDS